MTRLTRKETQLQTRERLLMAAQEEIALKGIDEASIRDISEAAGYSLGAFYSNFASKEEMLEQLQDRHMGEEILNFREIVHQTENRSGEEILEAISAWLKRMEKKQSQIAFGFELQMYAKRNEEFRRKFNSSNARRFQEVAGVFRDLFARYGRKPQIDFLQMAIGFICLWEGFFLNKTVPGAKSVNEIIMAFLKSLLESSTPIKPTRNPRKRSEASQ